MKPKVPAKAKKKPPANRYLHQTSRKIMLVKLDALDTAMENAIEMFGRLKGLKGNKRRVYGQMLREMKDNFIGSFTAIKEDVALNKRESALVNRIIRLLKKDYSAKTLAAFALGLLLFIVTLILNVIALHVVRKYREQYE